MFFAVYNDLCDKKGLSVYKVAQELGLNRSAVAKWKGGGKPNGTTLEKMADYFGVTVDFLLGKEKAPANEGERKISDDDLMFALWEGEDMDEDDLKAVREYAEFLRQKKRNQL